LTFAYFAKELAQAKDKRQKTKDKRQKTKDKRQKTKDKSRNRLIKWNTLI
jgi:hypothetical protein